MVRLARTAAVLLVIASFMFVAPPALAAPGNDGDPLSATPPLLDGGATYGSRTVLDESTSPNGQDSGYDSVCGGGPSGVTEGASVYRFTAPAGTKVSLSVTDDKAGQSLCALELFRSVSGGSTLTSIYDDPSARSAFRVGHSECPLTTSSCSVTWTLPASSIDYYVVFWPAGDGTPDSATYDFTAQVRMPTSVALSLSGYTSRAGSCYVLRTSGRLVAAAGVSPAGSTGTVSFRLLKRDASGTYRWVGAAVTALSSSSQASRTYTGLSHGRYNLRVLYGGDETHAPSSSSSRCIDVVATSTVRHVLSGWSSRVADYFVYRGGRTITVTGTVSPAPVGGIVRFRLEREVGQAAYRPFAVYERAVRSNGTVVFQFSMPYRSSGLPFYRIRAEYLGDRWHRPVTSAWICIQINR